MATVLMELVFHDGEIETNLTNYHEDHPEVPTNKIGDVIPRAHVATLVPLLR